MFCIMIMNTEISFTQCDILTSGLQSFNCDNGNTPGDPEDDSYTVTVNGFNNANDNFWQQQFGPFSVADPPPVVVLEDPLVPGCTLNVQILHPPLSCICQEFDVCFSLTSDDACTAEYIISITGNLENYYMSQLAFTFAVHNGEIIGLGFDNTEFNPFALNGVTLNSSGASGGLHIPGDASRMDAFKLIISTEPGSCAMPYYSFAGMLLNGLFCQANAICSEAEEFCPGIGVSGRVTMFDASLSNCISPNLGVANANVSISSSGEESCVTYTGSDGAYDCIFCEEGPYTICVNSTCPEPCGLENIDLVILREYLLGKRLFTKEFAFITDLNGDGFPSTLDILLMQRAILGLSTDNFNWCRYVPLHDFATAPGRDLNGNFPDYSDIDHCITLESEGQYADFIRFNIGDINGSCMDCDHDDVYDCTPLYITDKASESTLQMSLADTIFALTLKLRVDSSAIAFVHSPLPGYLYSIRGNTLDFIWTDTSTANDGYILSTMEEIISIEYRYPGQYEVTQDTADVHFVLTADEGIRRICQDTPEEYRVIADPTEKSHLTLSPMQRVLIQGDEAMDIFIRDMAGRIIHIFTDIPAGADLYDKMHAMQGGVYIIRIKNRLNDLSVKMVIPR